MSKKKTVETPGDSNISQCLQDLIQAIRSASDDWIQRAAEATLERDLVSHGKCLAISQHYDALVEKVEALQRQWNSGPRSDANRPIDATPTTRGRLRVFIDGETIGKPTAAETFARAIAKIGIERVKTLHKRLSGIALIETQAAEDYHNQFRIGGYYICTHSNTAEKKRLLEEIGRTLDISLRVEIIP